MQICNTQEHLIIPQGKIPGVDFALKSTMPGVIIVPKQLLHIAPVDAMRRNVIITIYLLVANQQMDIVVCEPGLIAHCPTAEGEEVVFNLTVVQIIMK